MMLCFLVLVPIQPSHRSVRLVVAAAALWLLAAPVTAQDGYLSLGWTRQTGTTTNDVGYGVAVSGDGSIYVTGRTDGSLNGLSLIHI